MNGLTFRETRSGDVPALIDVRGRTRDNAISADALAAMGITAETWATTLRTGDEKGWVCLDGEAVVGFSQARAASGEVVVLAVLPEYEGRGIGRELLEHAVAWLRESGCERIWLAGAPTGRAPGFYRSQGWRPTGERYDNGDEILELGELPVERRLAVFRRRLGEARFDRLVRELREIEDGELEPWHVEALKAFNAVGLGPLPSKASELLAMTDHLVTRRPTLSRTEVPEWVMIQWIEGYAPVQGKGTAGEWKWYFRSRNDEWSIGASRSPRISPDEVHGPGTDLYFHEERYGTEQFDASWMPHNEARSFIVRELTRLRELFGLDRG